MYKQTTLKGVIFMYQSNIFPTLFIISALCSVIEWAYLLKLLSATYALIFQIKSFTSIPLPMLLSQRYVSMSVYPCTECQANSTNSQTSVGMTLTCAPYCVLPIMTYSPLLFSSIPLIWISTALVWVSSLLNCQS